MHQEPSVNTWDDFVELLDLQSVLTQDADPYYLSVIILRGYLRPSHRGGRAWGKSYHRSEAIREFVRKKIGISCFDASRYDTALDWALRNGVIMRKKKGSAGICVFSLNTKERDATQEGARVIARIEQFDYEVLRPLRM